MPTTSPISPGVLNQNMGSSSQSASTKTGMRQRVHGSLTVQPIDTALHLILASKERAPTTINAGHNFDSTNINNNNTINNESNNMSKLRNKHNNLLEYTHIPAETQPSKPRLLQPRLRPVSFIQII
jgi:hypothetical protein